MIDLKELVKNPKEWQLERTTVSRCICVGPCLFWFAHYEPSATQSDVEIKIFDGQSDQGDLKLSVLSLYGQPCIPLPGPAFFRRGLYVDLTTNCAAVTVFYLPLRD